jgi:predicted transcriptional regulator
MLEQVASVVAAYLRKNRLAAEEIPALIQQVRAAFGALDGSQPTATDTPLVPAVPIRRSVFPDYLICLEDGKKLKMLKRHLRESYGLTPAAYRERWGLKADYPMVAPAYAASRSRLAKLIGLGRRSAPHEVLVTASGLRPSIEDRATPAPAVIEAIGAEALVPPPMFRDEAVAPKRRGRPRQSTA